MSTLRPLSLRTSPLLLGVFLTGCFGASATVVDSGGGQTVQQAQAAPYHGPQKRIAVSAFEFRAGQGSGEIGEGMSDMLTSALFNSGRFIVLEREQLKDVTKEQDLANSSRFRKDTAAPIGQLEGAELLIRGAVTQFEPNCKGGSVILASGKQACMAINLRIVDAATGRVLNATTVEGTSAENRVGIIWTRGSALPLGLGAYSKTPMEAAIRNCIETAVQHIVDTKL
jgi:curli biogenesis system outer membrane secretion channel CsgG